jgi:protein-disulfide isomerase
MSLSRKLIAAGALGLAVLAAPVAAQTFDPTLMSDSDREAFRAEIRAYLLENPEVIFEAVDIYRAREAELQEENAQIALADMAEGLYNDGTSFVGGNPDGDVTIIEFIDYRCGYCRKAHAELAVLLEEDTNIKWIVKEFPILGEASDLSSRVAMATLNELGPEAYLPMHNALMEFNGPINKKTVEKLAHGLGLDSEKIIEGMENEAIDAHWNMISEQAEALAITGTPAFIIGGDLARGYIQPDEMRLSVANARAENQ